MHASIRRREEGITTTQVVILTPAFLALIFLVFQYAYWYHAKTVAMAAAAEGLDAAQVLNAEASSGEDEVRAFVEGTGGLKSVQVAVERSADRVVVVVRGEALGPLSFVPWPVVARAVSAAEEHVPEPER